MKNKKSVHAIVHGRVQGVCFRMETKRAADTYGVSGWVRNKRDGTVEAVFEGEAQKVDRMLEWCKTGSSLSTVDRVEAVSRTYSGTFNQFSIAF